MLAIRKEVLVVTGFLLSLLLLPDCRSMTCLSFMIDMETPGNLCFFNNVAKSSLSSFFEMSLNGDIVNMFTCVCEKITKLLQYEDIVRV